MTTLPTTITSTTIGHFTHHELIHAFYNQHAATLEARLTALEAGLIVPAPRLLTMVWSKPGDIDDFLGTMSNPAPFDCEVLRVKVRTATAIAGGGASLEVDVLKEGSSIFTPGTYPKPTLTSGQTDKNVVPDPAKALATENQDFTVVGLVLGTPTTYPAELSITAVVEEQ